MDNKTAKDQLDIVIRKARVHFYKPIQIAEILYRDRIEGDIDLSDLNTYRTPSRKWRDAISLRFIGRISTSSAKYQDDLFKISREGFFSSIGKFFGMQDIEIGDPFFDKQFIIKGNDPKKIKLLLADDRIKELCQTQPRIHLSIKDDEGWFGTDFPEGVDELYFECVGVIKETALLKALFGLFCLVLQRLVQIDSAYEDDPQVVLK